MDKKSVLFLYHIGLILDDRRKNMNMLVNGKWQKAPLAPRDKQGHFIRQDSSFRKWVTQDGSSGYKAEPNRYHLYVSYACPWACRTLIFRVLKGLEDIISFSVVEPVMADNGWEFGAKEHASYLYEIYLTADKNYSGKVTVPVLWDKKNNTIVNNESADIIRMLNSEFNAFSKNQYDFYPEKWRDEIDKINCFVYKYINNGVYQCGFAGTQAAYDEAVTNLFNALDELEERLGHQRYLVGENVTEADWRLFTTLIRFDVVYVGHFKCNLKRIEDYENLSNYVRDLYQYPGIKPTVNFYHIKQHYYRSHSSINPSGIVPKGPLVDYDRVHNRDRTF